MGVILAILGFIVTFTMAMEALKRIGLDVGWLNPLTFFRRRAWKNKVKTPPLYALDHPVDVVSVLALAMVQTSGAVTIEQKNGVQALLQEHLSLSEADASGLWVSSGYLLRQAPLDPKEVPAIMARSADKFSEYHEQTLLKILSAAALIDPPINDKQQQLMDAVNAYFGKKHASFKTWSS